MGTIPKDEVKRLAQQAESDLDGEFGGSQADRLSDIIAATRMPPHHEFTTTLPYNQFFTYTPPGPYPDVMFTYLINNGAAGLVALPFEKEQVPAPFGPQAYLNALRKNDEVMEMLYTANTPFSLLGLQQLYTIDPTNKGLYMRRSPLLVVPGATQSEPHHDWMDAHARYYRALGFGPVEYKKRTSQERFERAEKNAKEKYKK
jgi:hypothetical protein